MTSKRLAFLCIGLLATSLVLAQAPTAPASADTLARQGAPQPANASRVNAYVEVGPTPAAVASDERDVAVSGSSCPAGYLCGQNIVGTTWLYSDLYFTNTDLTPPRSGRVTSETFPPPGGWALQAPVQLVSWRGTYIDDASNGCNKENPTHRFRVEFYTDANGDGKPDNCLAPVASFDKVPDVATRVGVGTINFTGGTISADEWEFTMLLDTPVNMASGVFSISSSAPDHPGCYFLLEPSLAPEGDSRTWRWYQSPDSCFFYGDNGAGTSTAFDIHYCFGKITAGACCYDCSGAAGCTASNDFICALQGGRFQAGVACGAMTPLCGNALGACCFDTGACTENLKCAQCQTATLACCFPDHSCQDLTPTSCAQHAGTAQGAGSTCTPTNPCAAPPSYCLGDLNCDGSVNFGDINPFVLYLSNPSAWHVAYPTCDPKSGDVNCDGSVYSFGDINPFVALLSQQPPAHCPHVCPAPEPRNQGPVWAGPNTTCTNCCVVVAGTPTEGETQNCVAVDTYNGGCFAATPAFTTIGALPATIYGQSGTFAGSPTRDEDWYAYTSAAPSIFTMTVRAEFSPNLFVIHAGSNNICLNWWQTDDGVAGDPCTDVTLVTHCLPAGKYYFLVRPLDQFGVPCGADYKLDISSAGCEPYAISCSAPNHTELSPCNDDPNHVNLDENGGCPADPNDPNTPVDPNAFELLTGFAGGTPYVICGTTWANNGFRDIDYYRFTLAQRGTVAWDVDTELPIEASMEFTQPTTGTYGPPYCGGTNYFWINVCLPGTITSLNQPSVLYPPGEYWFIVLPQIDATFTEGLFFGYPCGVGNTEHAYKVTMTYTPISCPDPCTDPSFSPNITEAEPTVGPNYTDSYNGGCDAGTPYHTIPTALSLNNDYCATTGSWLNDPNDPNSRHFDYDWYAFTTPASPPNSRWSMYLYGMTPMAWEIWPANNCAAGPLEGLEVGPCYTTAVKPAQCYPANTTYWLRVFPTDATSTPGDHYYVAMFSPTPCTLCSINCSGAVDNDNPCDDVNDFDTNYGCNNDPNGTYVPTAFLNFSVGTAYCGRSYAKQILVSGQLLGYYDPDWFKINLTAVTNLEIQIQAEFPCFVGLYAAGTNVNNPSCANYSQANPKAGTVLGGTGYKAILASCSGTNNTKLDMPALPIGVYVGVIFPIDYFGNLLTNYYPCGHDNKYWLKPVTYIP